MNPSHFFGTFLLIFSASFGFVSYKLSNTDKFSSFLLASVSSLGVGVTLVSKEDNRKVEKLRDKIKKLENRVKRRDKTIEYKDSQILELGQKLELKSQLITDLNNNKISLEQELKYIPLQKELAVKSALLRLSSSEGTEIGNFIETFMLNELDNIDNISNKLDN